MAYIVQPDVVHYACTCGLLKPISKLYFCRHCLQMRCGFCVCHEVDSHFCGKCAENIPSSEARLKKNRCLNCYDCPCCQHQLSLRVSGSSLSKSLASGDTSGNSSVLDTSAPTPNKTGSDSKSTKKSYYLACSYCRWNSRDVGIPDQSVATGGWPERENVHSDRLTAIQENYKAIVHWEKMQKIKKKYIQRGKYVTMTDKTGLTASMIRKRVGLPELPQASPKQHKDIPPATAREEVEDLPEDIFTKKLQLEEISTLEQRLLQPEWQPENVNLLFPVHKYLSVKRSLRCRTCEHNVSKPEYNPNSIKFKIQHFAYYHIPEVRLVTVETLQADKISEFIIKLCNPTQHPTTVSLIPFSKEDFIFESAKKNETSAESEANQSLSGQTSLSGTISSTLTRQPSIIVEPKPIEIKLSGEVAIPVPEVEIDIPPRDDTADYDDAFDALNYQDDPKFVTWRKSNKVALKLKVTPSAELNVGEKVVVGFILKHIYVNTIATIENKEPQKCNHSVKVFLTLGKIASE